MGGEEQEARKLAPFIHIFPEIPMAMLIQWNHVKDLLKPRFLPSPLPPTPPHCRQENLHF